jgi:hypothetical protein
VGRRISRHNLERFYRFPWSHNSRIVFFCSSRDGIFRSRQTRFMGVAGGKNCDEVAYSGLTCAWLGKGIAPEGWSRNPRSISYTPTPTSHRSRLDSPPTRQIDGGRGNTQRTVKRTGCQTRRDSFKRPNCKGSIESALAASWDRGRDCSDSPNVLREPPVWWRR